MTPREAASPPSPAASTSPDDPGPRFLAPAARPTSLSSRADDVLRAVGLPRRLDAGAAASLVAYGQYDVARSLFEGVALVPLRCPVARDPDGTLRVEPARAPAPRPLDLDAATTALVDAIDAATSDALRESRVAAVLLSGGLDSSAVAASAARAWRRDGRPHDDLRFVHVRPASGPTEVHHARAVARALGRALVEIEADDRDGFEGAEPMLARNDLAPDGGAPAFELALRRRLRDEGVDTVLTGDGGDEAFRAYGYRSLGAERGDAVRPRGAAWRARRAVAAATEPARRAVRHRRFLASLPAWLRERVAGRPVPRAAPAPREGLSGPAAERDRDLRCARQPAVVEWHRSLDRAVGTRTAMPLLDARVLDLVVSIPQSHHAAGGLQKGLLRRACADVLPPVQRDRPKDQPEVESAKRAALRRHGERWVRRTLDGGRLESRGFLPRGAGSSLIEAGVRGDDAALYRAYAVVALEAWMRARDVD